MPSNRLKFVVLGAIGLLVVLVAVLAFVLVNQRGAPKPAADKVSIEVSDTACTPNSVTVAAGAPSFSIRNTSGRTIEWEILNGVLVLAERENIAPGFTVEVTPRLEPGSYQMTCGMLGNARGTLTVTAADGTTTALPAAPKLADLVAPTAEYRVYAIKSSDQLAAATAALAAALKTDDLPGARARLADAVTALAQLAPILHLFERDTGPLLTGPSALLSLTPTLAAATPDPSVAGLVDVAARSAIDLGGSIRATTASPHEIVAGAGEVVGSLAKGGDLPPDAASRIAGVGKVVELFRPLTLRADRALSSKLDADLSAVEASLANSPATASQTQLADLAADLIALQAALGLNAT